MELNLASIILVFFRLAPFILVCFFIIASIFNQDVKGVVYLVGLIFACFLNLMIENTGINNMSLFKGNQDEGRNCKDITFHLSGLGVLPLSQTVFAYTFAYLLWVIVSLNIVEQNISTIVFFSLIMFIDILWNSYNSCFTMVGSIVSICIGGGMGTFWGYIVDMSKNPNLQYFTGFSSNEVCSKPSKSTFRCKVYKNGQLL
jgi:hypothetical protein